MHKWIIAVAAFLALNVAVAGESVRVGFSVSTFNDTFISNVAEAARRYAAKNPGVVLEMLDAQDDSVREQDQVVTLLDSGVDALVVLPVESNSVAAIVQAAQEANKPLIFVNRNLFHGMEMPKNIYYVGANTLLEGEEQMRYIAGKLGGEGEIAIIMGALSHEATMNRSDGVRRVAAEYPGITIVGEETATWQRALGINAGENLITAHPNLKAILCNNDEMALGALIACQNMDRTDILVAGIDGVRDATNSIKAGGLAASVLQDSGAQGQGSIDLAVRVVRGENVPQLNLLPVQVITPDNVEEITARLEQ
ncbi:MAG: substrate-binding domain-containing protein [Planctomycetaceae bacterium]|nr:substrate-binding domain-containing protein [Planctomycetaceae bacterium]